MDIDECRIGQWPNIAIDPRTGRHAATGEEIERGGLMSDETTLLPCPFCGGKARHYAPGPIDHHIECAECYADIHRDTEAEVSAVWNTRAMLGSGTCEMHRDDFGDWHCAACENGADTITGSDGILYSWNDSWAPNFCPNCGRKVVER